MILESIQIFHREIINRLNEYEQTNVYAAAVDLLACFPSQVYLRATVSANQRIIVIYYIIVNYSQNHILAKTPKMLN